MYKPGSVVLVNFPFSDLQSAKVRPALVLTAGRDDVIILGIFSKVPEMLRASWVRIDDFDKDFKGTGLKKTSIIKTEQRAPGSGHGNYLTKHDKSPFGGAYIVLARHF